jgi:DNA-directed RNA polymerase, mitochondrial
MDLAILPAEFERSKSKIAKIDGRKEAASGFGATTSGQSIVTRYHERLTEAFRIAVLDAHAGLKSETELVLIVRGLSPALLALISIQTILHSIGLGELQTATLLSLGTAAAAECWAAKLTEDKDGITRRLAREVRRGNPNVARRLKTMEAKIDRAIEKGANVKREHKEGDKKVTTTEVVKLDISFKMRVWSAEARVVAGSWLWNVVSAALPEVFSRNSIMQGCRTFSSATLSESSWGIVDQALDLAMISNPVYWPSATPPKPWTYWNDGGSWDERVTASVLRTYHKDTQAAVKNAIKSGQMQPALDAVNTLQSVAFKINTRVLEVIEQCDALGIQVKGLTPQNRPVEPKPNAFAWEAMDKSQQGRFKAKNAEIAKRNRGFLSDRLLFAEDMKTAYAMLEHRRFYTPMNCDWRGRVYGLSHFNFQREDRVRALFLFTDGEPIGDEGIEWLKVHTSNCGDFEVEVPSTAVYECENCIGMPEHGCYCSAVGAIAPGGPLPPRQKISKRPINERKQWCDDNSQMITNIASEPLVHTSWMNADKPFLFLAACFELSMAWAQGSSFITQLPVSFDGSCSGLQHLCAMTRAVEGSMVNLTSSSVPQDVYQVIADDAFEAIAADTENADLAKLFLEFDGNRRTAVKRNVMTYAYSSKKFGMASQQQVDLMQPLADAVLDGKMEEHPFEGYQYGPYDKDGVQQPSKAARFLAGHVYEAIIKRIHKPAEAMEFLQKIAKALAHEGKPVRWTTPVGIPWINRYHEPIISRVELFLNDGGIKSRARAHVVVGDKKAIDKEKAANGVAPNFVHALDASHLLLVANAAASEGIGSIATVHDSFGCLASQATRFNAIIREQFALMYSNHDVLSEILERARADLTPANHSRLPALPQRGLLDLKEILNAQYAFA